MNYLVASLALLFGCIMALWHPKKALGLAVFFLPWWGLNVEIGLGFTPYLALWIPLGFATLLHYKNRSAERSLFGLLFICWSLGISLVQIPFLPEVQAAGGPFRQGAARTVSSMIMLLFTVVPVLVIPKLAKTAEDISRLAEIYVFSMIVLCVFAWFQIVVFKLTGVDPLPIGMLKVWAGAETASHVMVEFSAINTYGDQAFFRPSSFGGEPKDLAMSILYALVLVQIGLAYNRDKRYRKLKAKLIWIFLFVTIAVTQSSTAYILFVTISLAIFLFNLVHSKYVKPGRAYLLVQGCLVIGLAVLTVAVYSIGKYDKDDADIMGILYERTFGRFESTETYQVRYFQEDMDEPIISFLLDNPFYAVIGVGLGNAHLYSYPYTTWIDPALTGIYCHVAKRGYLRLVSECGLIGLSLFLLWFFHYVSKLKRSLPYLSDKYRHFVTRIIVASYATMLMFLASAQVTEQLFAALGVAIASCSLIRCTRKEEYDMNSFPLPLTPKSISTYDPKFGLY